jgi:GR25 family glycosyltransferase involved in LPS biosynthesis
MKYTTQKNIRVTSTYFLVGFICFLLFLLWILYEMDIGWRTKTQNQTEGFDDSRAPIHPSIHTIYYINLQKRKDREEQFLNNFSTKDQQKIIRINGHYYPENGAVGCLMSHISALNRALNDANDNGENILICEDDFHIKDINYCNKMLDLLFSNIENWDVIMLGQNTIESEDTGIQTENNEKIIRIKNSQTTSGYLIKKKYISRLLKIYETDMNKFLKNNEWENYYTDQSWKVLQPVDRWYTFNPPVAVQSPSYSDIQNGFINVEV